MAQATYEVTACPILKQDVPMFKIIGHKVLKGIVRRKMEIKKKTRN
jgi:hypothetical protein